MLALASNGQARLFLGQRDADRVDPMAGRGVDHEAAPTAADVEHALALAQPELLADELELGLLGLRERLRPARPVGTRIRHRLVEEQGEEVVADVVVVANRPPIARDRVALAAQPELRGRRLGRDDDPACAYHAQPEPDLRAPRQRRRLERVDDPQRAVEVVDLEQPVDERPAQAELARCAEHVRQGAW